MAFQAQNLFGVFKEKYPCRSPVLVSRLALFSPRGILTKVDSNSVGMWLVRKSSPIVASVLMLRHVYQKILLNLMHLSPAIRGADPGDIRGNNAGFADFCCQFLAREGGIGPLLHSRGKIQGERPAGFVTLPPS